MRYTTDGVKDLTITYIGCGSRGWAWELMQDLALESAMEGEVRLYDIDRAAAECNAVIGNKISASPQAVAQWRYVVADSLASALDGADFIVISILPGTFKEMDSDISVPEEYGIYQSVGDTTGPGGLVRALRTIPMYVEIAQAISRYAPDAYVINYTNPMALCVRTLYEVFPGIHAFGCCHEVFHAQQILADMLREKNGLSCVNWEDIRISVTGVNHFTWISRAFWQGTDLIPMFADFASAHAKDGYEDDRRDAAEAPCFRGAHKVMFDLFLRYGMIPAANDRHLAEFMPPWYLKDPETIAGWRFSLTPVEWRYEDLERRLARSRALRSGEESVRIKPSGEKGSRMMLALLGLGDMISNVNLPNRGQVPNLPLMTVVETNAVFGRAGISPVVTEPIPPQVLSLIMPHALNQELIFKAAMLRDRKTALQALLSEPLVRLSPDDAEKMLNAMIDNTLAYLPAQWRR